MLKVLSAGLSIGLGVLGGAIPVIFQLVGTFVHSQQTTAAAFDPWSAAGSVTMGGILVWVIRASAQTAEAQTREREALVARYDVRMQDNINALKGNAEAMANLTKTLEYIGYQVKDIRDERNQSDN